MSWGHSSTFIPYKEVVYKIQMTEIKDLGFVDQII